jgi:rhodanese-related sulfurtransferase
MRHIEREAIAQHLKAKTPMILVEALGEKHYRDGHLPGALNIPHERVRELAPERLPDKSAFIVTYCANTPCQNSRIAAQTLEALGYTNVAEYVEGKQDWVDAGLPLEQSSPAKAA